jgi:hypothetical protein
LKPGRTQPFVVNFSYSIPGRFKGSRRLFIFALSHSTRRKGKEEEEEEKMRSSAKRQRRQRRPPAYFHASSSATAAEERLLQHAIQNSKLDRGRPPDGRLSVPSAPTFFPTVEDFEGNPIHYIEKIRPVAERYGVCKIVPPKGWNPAPFGTCV